MSYTENTENEDALNDLNNIRDFLKERGLFDDPCKERSKYTIGDIVEDFAYLVDKSIRARENHSIQTKKNKIFRNTKEYNHLQWDKREEEMQTDEFKAKYKCIIPHRVTFSIWRDSDEDSYLETESFPYEDHKGRDVELEVLNNEYLTDNCWNSLWEIATKLTIDDLEESDISL